MKKTQKNENVLLAYHRVSSAEQASGGLSLGMQNDETEKYGKEKGYIKIIHFEDAGKSGANLNPSLKDMLKYIKDNCIKKVVVWKLDRLSRSQEIFFGIILPALRKANCTIASIVERFDDIYEIDPLLLSIYIGQAEQELVNTKKRTRTVLKHRAEQGYKLGKAPIGYLNSRDSHGHGIIIPDPKTRHYIVRAFELYATGIFSMERLGKELAKYGFVDSQGKPYPKKRIADMLQNPVYIGKVPYGNETFDGKHEAIISDELFYRVQLMFSDTRKTRTHNTYFTYSNYIKCAKCGYSYVGTLRHGANKSGDYIYYHCNNYKKTHAREKNIRQEYIDEAMQEIIDSFDISDKDIKKIKTQVYNAVEDLRTYEKKSIKELEAQYSDLTDKICDTFTSKSAGNSGMSEITRKEIIKKLEAQKDSVQREIANLNESSKDTVKRMSILMDFANRLPELYLKATLEEKRLILTTITDKILYNEDTNVLSVQLKPIFEQLRQLKLHNKQIFSSDINILTGTLETRSESAKQALRNDVKTLSDIEVTGTHRNVINVEFGVDSEDLKKSNVDGGT